MTHAPRRLTADEARLWAALAGTVTPLAGRKAPVAAQPAPPAMASIPPAGGGHRHLADQPATTPPPRPRPRPLTHHGLDGGWERRLAKGALAPDVTIDLHGANLAAAYARLHAGIDQAAAMGARVLLLVTGRDRDTPRPSEQRGAIRAQFLDWLSVGPHAGTILAVRPAHIRHGGPGAVYIVLRRGR